MVERMIYHICFMVNTEIFPYTFCSIRCNASNCFSITKKVLPMVFDRYVIIIFWEIISFPIKPRCMIYILLTF